MKRYFIQKDDVGKSYKKINCPCCNSVEVIYFSSCLGNVLPCDVGKMMVKYGDIWQVENQEQFEKRIAVYKRKV
jgi:hypothetical protein